MDAVPAIRSPGLDSRAQDRCKYSRRCLSIEDVPRASRHWCINWIDVMVLSSSRALLQAQCNLSARTASSCSSLRSARPQPTIRPLGRLHPRSYLDACGLPIIASASTIAKVSGNLIDASNNWRENHTYRTYHPLYGLSVSLAKSRPRQLLMIFSSYSRLLRKLHSFSGSVCLAAPHLYDH